MYEVANGQRIPNLGEKLFVGASHEEGRLCQIKAQVCDVSKPLMSVSRLVKAGHSVVFGPEAAYIQDGTTGERMSLQESGGMFTLKMWVQNKAAAPASGF